MIWVEYEILHHVTEYIAILVYKGIISILIIFFILGKTKGP